MRISDWSSYVCSSDLSGEGDYRVLKSVLDGSLEQAPDNVLLYATSNRRHLVPEKERDNENWKRVGSEERREWKECDSTSRHRWSPDHKKTNQINTKNIFSLTVVN